MLERIGRVALPPWAPIALMFAVVSFFSLIAVVLPPPELPYISVAFVGNSMQYYNDFPRFMEALADGHLTQNSCLHGDANLQSILLTGNGMYQIWDSGAARVFSDDATIHDFGACTVKQLLFGYDEDLEARVGDNGGGDEEQNLSDDYWSFNDLKNPCLNDEYYLGYLDQLYAKNGAPQYDFIVLNDNTRSPARNSTRTQSLEVLESTYIDWFLETKAIPVFICTYGYWTPYRDMGGLSSVPEFTSLTYEGYRQYAELVGRYLPDWQQPRVAPVGLAFLLLWEENYSLWERLFHVDQIHTSPMGTYLQGCVVYFTLFGEMPGHSIAVQADMWKLFQETRRFQPGEHRRSPFPTKEEAAYLYYIADRVTRQGYIPKSFVRYHNGEAAEYTPQDDLYRVDDLY